MALIKCPRCELNYIEEGEGYCKICKREMKGEAPREEVEMCTVCNERPAMPGKDMCVLCYKEMQSHEEPDENEEHVAVDVGIDPVSTMDEIVPEIDEDIPAREYNEIENDLSLDEMSDEEAEKDENVEKEDE